MRKPPDLFELRLDRLAAIVGVLQNKLSGLQAPLIITARHPQEGGANPATAGSLQKRRDLLTRFLPRARYLDVELRSASALCSLLTLAKQKNIQRIISFHDFKSTPPVPVLRAKAHAAKACGADIFKLATRTDTPAQLARLLDFVAKRDVDLPVSAMGIGKLGAISRVLLARAGSALVYASLGQSDIEGQLSIGELRKLGIGKCE